MDFRRTLDEILMVTRTCRFFMKYLVRWFVIYSWKDLWKSNSLLWLRVGYSGRSGPCQIQSQPSPKMETPVWAAHFRVSLNSQTKYVLIFFMMPFLFLIKKNHFINYFFKKTFDFFFFLRRRKWLWFMHPVYSWNYHPVRFFLSYLYAPSRNIWQ